VSGSQIGFTRLCFLGIAFSTGAYMCVRQHINTRRIDEPSPNCAINHDLIPPVHRGGLSEYARARVSRLLNNQLTACSVKFRKIVHLHPTLTMLLHTGIDPVQYGFGQATTRLDICSRVSFGCKHSLFVAQISVQNNIE